MEQFILVPENKIKLINKVRKGVLEVCVMKTTTGKYIIPVSVIDDFPEFVNEQKLGPLTIVELPPEELERTFLV